MPCIVVLPNTAISSFSKYKDTFKKDFDNCELIIQYIWGKKKILIKIDIQFNIKLKDKILIVGSKDENKFIIFCKQFLLKNNNFLPLINKI